ncbi:MAG: metal ABC transporter substrate-binding protein [Planctomycetota bacterium]|nr:metal ABC transporter substrate-binding protein [Planctomycetota bacterium]
MNHPVQHVLHGLLATGALIGFGCDLSGGTSTVESQESPPRVFAVNFPLQSFAQTVGGDDVVVDSPALEGVSALSFDPSPEQIIKIQDARLILLNGADFANWTANASLPSSRTIVTAKGFRNQWLECTHHHHHHDHDHQHGPDGEGVHHHHSHWASYTWLDPNHARAQATAVIGAMQGVLSSRDAMSMRPRATALIAELGALADQAAEIRAAKLPPIIASEAYYPYFAAACGLDLHEADWHWNEPEPHEGMDSLRNLIKATGARHLLVPEAPTAERMKTLRDLGLEPVVIMPLADPPSTDSTASFSTLMKANLDRIQALGVTTQSAE